MDSSSVGSGHVHCCKSACRSKSKKANSVDPDETARYDPFHLDLHSLQSGSTVMY